MNQDANQVALPKGATYQKKPILKVLKAVIGETTKDSGYMILLDDGQIVFIRKSQFDALAGVKE